MPTKKYLRKKAKKSCLIKSNCDRKSQLSGILTEPFNPSVAAEHPLPPWKGWFYEHMNN